MEFKIELENSDIYCWKEKLKLSGSQIPTFRHLSFKEKWNSIYNRYETARMFLTLAKDHKYDLFRMKEETKEIRTLIDFRLKKEFYESALVNYNFVIDYSWQLVYFYYEFDCYCKDKKIDLDTLIKKEEAKSILNELEHKVDNPMNKEGPLFWLKKHIDSLEYNKIFHFVVVFLQNNTVKKLRNNYNKLKHCGNLLYEEELNFEPIIIQTEYAMGTSDLNNAISLKKSIEDLVVFDNDYLLNYLSELLIQLKDIVKLPDLAYIP